jgi:hypothetical protein
MAAETRARLQAARGMLPPRDNKLVVLEVV